MLDDARQVTDVIKMGVGEHHGVERLHIEGNGPPVAFAEFLEALEEAAVDEDVGAVGFEEILRPGDGARGAVKSQCCDASEDTRFPLFA